MIGPASASLYAGSSALDPDAGVYVGGVGTATGQTPVLGHVTSQGAIDLGGDAGWIADNFFVEQDFGYVGLAVQSDGRVLGIGNGNDMEGSLPYIARTTSDGKLDKTFNADAGANAGYYIELTKTNVTFHGVAVAPLTLVYATSRAMLEERNTPSYFRSSSPTSHGPSLCSNSPA